jgi:hypothetical protein
MLDIGRDPDGNVRAIRPREPGSFDDRAVLEAAVIHA